MEIILARAIQLFLALAGGYLIVLWFALVVWTYRDIGARSRSVVTQVFATLLSLLFFVPGVLLYLLMRPGTTLDEAFQRSLEEEYLLQDIEEASLCPSCQRQVSDDYILCPHCQANLQHACTSCAQLIKIDWPVCPYCGSDQTEQTRSIRERVEPPDDRYLARGAQTFRQVTASAIHEHASITPVLDHDHRPELDAVGSEPQLVAEAAVESETAHDDGPIKLFDRKRTRARKQKTQKSEAAPVSNGHLEHALDESANSDSEVIAQFVSNGNGNGAHAHATESESGEMPDPEAEAALVADSTSSR